jgi:hypothetical protein
MNAMTPTTSLGRRHSLGAFLAELCSEARDGLEGEARRYARVRMADDFLALPDSALQGATLSDDVRCHPARK